MLGYYDLYESRFDHVNSIGSQTVTTIHDGSVDSDQTLYPWGQYWNSSGTHIDGEIFGGFQIVESWFNPWLNPTNTRKYNSLLYRWLTPDPAGRRMAILRNPQSWNQYVYVLDNPLRFVDPLGLGQCGDHPCPPIVQSGQGSMVQINTDSLMNQVNAVGNRIWQGMTGVGQVVQGGAGLVGVLLAAGSSELDFGILDGVAAAQAPASAAKVAQGWANITGNTSAAQQAGVLSAQSDPVAATVNATVTSLGGSPQTADSASDNSQLSIDFAAVVTSKDLATFVDALVQLGADLAQAAKAKGPTPGEGTGPK